MAHYKLGQIVGKAFLLAEGSVYVLGSAFLCPRGCGVEGHSFFGHAQRLWL